MRYINLNHSLLVTLMLLTTGCANTLTETVTPTFIPTEIPAPAPLPTASPTLMSTPALEAGQGTFVFYHDGLEQVVLVNGGPEHGKPADDPLELWGWDGTQWSLVSADKNGPAWRNWAAIAYDPSRNILVIHGGLQDRNYFDETWEWDGQTWTRFTDTNPREGAVMAYDTARAKMVLFGGADSNMEIHGTTWEWDGQTWTQVSETGPAPRFPGGMVYDPARQEILMYSGHFADPSGDSIDYDDLWAWDGRIRAWREIAVNGPTPGHRTHAGFVYDPMTEKVLLIGSGSETFLSDMWAWDGAQWEEIPAFTTPARSGHTVAYDPNRDRFVLFGGVDRPGGRALDDTWEWDRLQWSCVSNC
jgi:hypothetical protein